MIKFAPMRRDIALLSSVFLVVMAYPANAGCVTPRYRPARIVDSTAANVSLYISIRLEDFAPERLVCLAGGAETEIPKSKYVGCDIQRL